MSTAFDDIQNLQADLIRKAVNGSAFIGASTVTAVTKATLFDSTGEIQALPDGYSDLGYTTDAGTAFARAITETQVTSWQATSPTRSDRTADTTTATVVCQETKLATIGLYAGVDTSTVTPDPTSGAVEIAMPATPVDRYYRLLVVAEDTSNDAGSIYVCRFLPRAKVTDVASQSLDKADEIQWGVTFTGFVDSTVGTAEKYLFGGPGWLALTADMGFSSSSSSSSSS